MNIFGHQGLLIYIIIDVKWQNHHKLPGIDSQHKLKVHSSGQCIQDTIVHLHMNVFKEDKAIDIKK